MISKVFYGDHNRYSSSKLTFSHLADPDYVRPMLQCLDEKWICDAKNNGWPATTSQRTGYTLTSVSVAINSQLPMPSQVFPLLLAHATCLRFYMQKCQSNEFTVNITMLSLIVW